MPDWAQHLMPRLDVVDQLLSDVCYLHLGSKTQPCSSRLTEENATLLFKPRHFISQRLSMISGSSILTGKSLHQNVAKLSSGKSICQTLNGRKWKHTSGRAFPIEHTLMVIGIRSKKSGVTWCHRGTGECSRVVQITRFGRGYYSAAQPCSMGEHHNSYSRGSREIHL